MEVSLALRPPMRLHIWLLHVHYWTHSLPGWNLLIGLHYPYRNSAPLFIWHPALSSWMMCYGACPGMTKFSKSTIASRCTVSSRDSEPVHPVPPLSTVADSEI